MKYIDKWIVSIIAPALLCSEAYAAGFVKYDGIDGEALSAQVQHQRQQINRDLLPLRLSQGVHFGPERRAERSGAAPEQASEEFSFYFNKIPAVQPQQRPKNSNRVSTVEQPQTTGLLLPAVQKVRH